MIQTYDAVNVYLILLTAIGITNAYCLRWQFIRLKTQGKRMYCFLGEDCSKVVGSKYGTHFGVKNETIGIFYYLTILLYAASFLFIKVPAFVTTLIMVEAAFATAFSFYLFYLQAIVLKTYCSWCLIAILINILIFFAIFYG